MQVIKYVILTNKLTETYVANADHNAIQLELDFTGTNYASWAKWVQLLMNDGTEDLKELGTDTIVHFTLTSAHTKQGYLSINPKAISAEGYVKGFPVRTVLIDKQLNVEQVSAELQQSIIDYFNQRLAIKSVSTETLEPDQPVDVIVQQAADGQTYLFKIPKGGKGDTGAKIVSAAFSGNDILFTLDDASTATLTGAAITLKGAKGDTGAKIVSAAFVGNDIILTLDDASTVTLIDAAITLKGAKGDKGIVWRGAYSAGTAYVVDDVVSYNGSSYICILASTGNLPTNATYWSLVAQAGEVTTTQLNNAIATKADKLYATNLVTNGDFSVDSNADGLADNWIKPQPANSASIVSGWQRITNVSSNRLELRQTLTLTSGRKYYILFTFRTNYVGVAPLAVSDNTYVETLYSTLNRSGTFSTVFTPSTTKSDISFRIYNGSDVLVNDYFEFDYITIIDLTTLFGAGKEPSATQMDNMLSTFTNSWFNGTAELVSIANLAQLKADKTQEAWITPTLQNSWVKHPAFGNAAGYYKDQFGIVHFQGTISGGTAGTVAFTLPTGYRPGNYCYFICPATATNVGKIEVNGINGNVTISNFTTWIGLEGVTFRAV